MDHGNNQTRSAIPQAAWCQLNRGRIRRLLGYNCDAFEFTRYFSPDLLLDKHFGDWTTICETPSIVKTRPLSGDNINNVILNLDKVRHFVFLKDKRTFASKWDKAVFRGAAYQPHRRRFMENFWFISEVRGTRP